MRTLIHDLPAASAGTNHRLRSLHFGRGVSGRKAYLQAALHADEVPPLLVAQALMARLQALDAAGAIAGEIVLVPMANPIGLSQDLQGAAFGRFDLATGTNFNRQFRHLSPALAVAVEHRLGADAAANTRVIRAAARELLGAWQPATETEALKRLLQTLAIDADLVLDLHCDNQAVMHVYTGTPQVEALRPLAAYLGAQALLYSEVSGDDPFDETASRIWWELAAHFAGRFPIDANACLAATIELRGEGDVRHDLAAQDAAGILRLLVARGIVRDDHAAELPPLRCQPTPLAGSMPINAPTGGVLVFVREPGAVLAAGEPVAELIDPLSGAVTVLATRCLGLLFARENRRYAVAGMPVAKVAGSAAVRSGALLSA